MGLQNLQQTYLMGVMWMRRFSLALILALLSPWLCGEEDPFAGLPAARAIGPEDVQDWDRYVREDEGASMKLEIVPAQPDGTPALLRATSTIPMRHPWSAGLSTPVTRPLARGDVLVARLRIRTLESSAEHGLGQIQVGLQLSREPWTKSALIPVFAKREWQELLIPFESREDYAPGEASMFLFLGFQPQTIELTRLELIHLGQTAYPEDRPRYRHRLYYSGMEEGAAWRELARERIRRIRGDTMTVRVLDSLGRPVTGAQVEVAMARQAFPFGVAVQPDRLLEPLHPDNVRYRQHLLELFNAVVIENHLKWPAWAQEWGPDFDRRLTLGGLLWLRQHGLPVRGHVLLWPGWDNLPRFLREKQDPAQLRGAVQAHFREIMTATRGLVHEWDVLNEPFDNNALEKLLGREFYHDVFQWAKEQGVPLYINDYGILTAPRHDTAHPDFYAALIHDLLSGGAPLDGIGMQGHFSDTHLPSPEEIWATLDRFSAFGLPIKITELDIRTSDEEGQALYLRDVLLAAFAHDAVVGIFQWGFWEGAHWLPEAAHFRKDWSERPLLEAYRELVFGEWWTRFSGQSDILGCVAGHAFFGDHVITVRTEGGETSFRRYFDKDMAEIEVRLSAPALPPTPRILQK